MRGRLSTDPAEISEDQAKAIADAEGFGMDEASIANLIAAFDRPSPGDDSDGVWPEHVEIVRAFLAVATQFRVVATGGGCTPSRLVTIGLDYAGVRAGLDAEGIVVTPELWNGLRIMEIAATAALNKKDS